MAAASRSWRAPLGAASRCARRSEAGPGTRHFFLKKSGFDAFVPGMGTRKQPIPVALAAVALACVLVWHFMDQRTQDRKIQALEKTVDTLQASLRQKEDELTQTPLHVRDGNEAQSPAG